MKSDPILEGDKYPEYVKFLPENMRTFIFDATRADIATRAALKNVIDGYEFKIEGGATQSGVFIIDNDSKVRGRLKEIFDEDFLVNLQDNGVRIVI